MTSLSKSLSMFADRTMDCIKSKRPIMVLTHMDCDGLTSGSIIGKALIRTGANCTIRSSIEFSPKVAKSLSKDSRAFHIITDLGGGFADDLDRELGDQWLVLDHHHIPDTEFDNERVINSWKFDIDGGVDICAGGMAYLAAVSLDKNNSDLSPLAVVAALGDRQDQGEKRSLTGKNKEISKVAEELELLEIDMDLLLYGRETRPIADALAYTSQPYIKGVTWERGNCASLLKNAGIELKESGRWRVPAELTQDEKVAIIDAIAKYASGPGVTESMAEIIGHTYTLIGEESGSFLRDCREFGTMLNSCGRIGKPGVGIAVSMGDRNNMLTAAEETLKEYKGRIREYMNIISNDRWRVTVHDHLVMVNAEGVVPETMSGTIASMISGSPKYNGKIIILRTSGAENTIKFSSRKAQGCTISVSLSDLLQKGTERFGGMSGGHDMAAGARIDKEKLDEYLDYLEANVNNIQSDHTPKS